MKFILFCLTISILILISTFTYAQKLKPNSTVKANQTTFRIEEVKQFGTSSNGITVVNVNNIYRNHAPKVYMAPGDLYGKIEKGGMLRAFKLTFNDNRLRQLLPDHGINLKLYISPDGKVEETDFLLENTTLLNAKELAQLQNAIKTNVFFKLSPGETKGGDFFTVSLFVKYQNVLDGIER